MSLVRTEITLKNTYDKMRAKEGFIAEDKIRQITVQALVDTGAATIVINEAVREELGLDLTGYDSATLADGSKIGYDLAGPVEIMWKNRHFICEALILPDADEILLGALPLEGMDLTINPSRELVGVHGDIVLLRV